MFESLSSKMDELFGRLSRRGRLTEGDLSEALREVRRGLLEADVHVSVVRDFIERVGDGCRDLRVLESLTPAQHVLGVVHKELITVLGGAQSPLNHRGRNPATVLLVGLQGSGKTTTAAKLALHVKKQGESALLVAADPRRPAAAQQLMDLAGQVGIPMLDESVSDSPANLSRNVSAEARSRGVSWVIIDTAGRLITDEELMKELDDLGRTLDPAEVLLVVDSMTGQEAVNIAREFHERVGLTGLILTKMDGDARGGAALSITTVTGLPIKFIGIGEKLDSLEMFYPDRLASRIMGMGDLAGLAEKVQESLDGNHARDLQRKITGGSFDLEDFMAQLQQLKSMGPLNQILDMVPGFSGVGRRLPQGSLGESHIRQIEAIICSMSPLERRKPDLINGSRRRRIAFGSGTTPTDVNRLLNQFWQSRQLMHRMASGKRLSGRKKRR